MRGNLCPENQWKMGYFENKEHGGLFLFLKSDSAGM